MAEVRYNAALFYAVWLLTSTSLIAFRRSGKSRSLHVRRQWDCSIHRHGDLHIIRLHHAIGQCDAIGYGQLTCERAWIVRPPMPCGIGGIESDEVS